MHTLALVASPTARQWGWGDELGLAVGSQSGRLQKWSARSNRRYRAAFAERFPKLLAESDVWVMARTTTAAEIKSRAHAAMGEYGLSRFIDVGGPTVAFGPSSDGVTYNLRNRVAVSVLATFDFVVRMHRAIHGTWSESADWQISPDSPPDGVYSDAASVFSALVNSAQVVGLVHGRLSVLTHLRGDQGADLADNVAGLLRDAANNGGAIETVDKPARGAIYWER